MSEPEQVAVPEPIQTPKVPVSSSYHGTTVTEDYRWLEEAGSEQTRAWTAAQDRRTRDYLASLPCYGAIAQRAGEVMNAASVSYGDLRRAGQAYFALKQQPPAQQPFLVVLSSLDDLSDERVLVDPNQVDDSGSTTIDWYQPSPDGSLVAVSLSERGTEDGTVHVYRTATGELVGDTVPRVHGGTAGGSVAWAGDSGGFWHTRYPAPGEHPGDEDFYQEVWYHQLGAAAGGGRRELAGVFADDRIAENVLSASPDGKWVMDRVQKGDGGEWQVFVRAQSGGDWWLAADVADKVSYATFGPGSLYLLSRQDAPLGKVLRLTLLPGATVAQAVTVVPEAAVAIDGASAMSEAEGGLAVTDTRLWVLDMDGGWSTLRLFDLDGKPAGAAEVPPGTAIGGLIRLDGQEIGYPTESYTQPRCWWRAAGDAPARRTALAATTALNFAGVEVRREFASSADGSRVPVTLLTGREAAGDGTAPVLLTGYGGYGISIKPRFDPFWLPWLEQGGVVAVANIRGGGEYGEAWHHEGRLAAKQNCFDDFAACARFLVQAGVTTSERLAILGGSNGGLLMGAVLTQHPGLCRAVVAMVPVMDTLRNELHPNGAFNVTEFGTVADPELFRALRAYSPYHNVEDGAAYPAVLLTAGEFDPRVDAYHAKKMTARLQAATSSGEPVLLRVESGGHGIGSSLDQQVSEIADVYAFLFDRLGLDYLAASCR